MVRPAASHLVRPALAGLVSLALLAGCAGRFGARESLPPETTPASFGAPTGTPVGARVAQLRGDLANLTASVASNQREFAQLRQSISENQARYQAGIAAITARLQVGTTPGNPELLRQWQEAQATLAQVERDVGAMSALSTRVAANSSVANFLLGSTRAAFALSGGIDQDHRDLGAIEDEVGRQQVTIDRMLNEIAGDSSRLAAAVASDRRNLSTLALAINSGRMYGANLSNRISAVPAPGPRSNRPLATIRFDRPDLAWRQPLYNAVASAIDRAPGATFDVVAVTATQGPAVETARAASETRRNAETVVRAMVEMGLPSERIALSSAVSPRGQNEVLVFVR
jgi:hypothetical protein